MAFAKIQKQLNIANQLITEKVFNGEKSKFNDDFTEMEKKTDATVDMVDDLQNKTKEFLQPNPAARAKMAAMKLSSGQAKTQYPQTEGILGNAMMSHGKKLGDDDILGQSLIEIGESLRQISDVKYSLDNNVKQNFLEPLQHLQQNDIKEVLHHRKKLSNRRLDYDCKKRKQNKGGATEEEIRIAQEKFSESLNNASTSMHHLLENDVELISQLAVFSESLMTYYQQCAEIMQELTNKLYEKKSEAMNRPKKNFIPTTLSDLNIDSLSIGSNNDRQNNNSNNGARLNNFDRFKATSISNISYKHSNGNNTSNNNFSRTSKLYGSQSNLSTASSTGSRYQTVHSSSKSNYNINSPKTSATGGDVDKWMQAWDDSNGSNYRAPSYHSNAQTHSSHDKFNNNLPNNSVNNNNNAFKRSNSNQNQFANMRNTSSSFKTADPFDPFDDDAPFSDPWSAKPSISNPIPLTQPQSTVNLINNFNNNLRNQSNPYPHCVALYDFDAENAGELTFKENDVIRLLSKVDDNWYEGMLQNGRTGYIPKDYVQVKIPLP